MAPITRRLQRVEEPRTAAAVLALALLAILAAFGYSLTISAATTAGVVAAAALVGIAGTGLLYAWRAVTGASSE